MTGKHLPMEVRLLWLYYGATLLFIVLDYALNINVRLAFLASYPALKALYYVVCFGCLGLMIWRPAWSAVIATTESLVTLSLLIVNMALQVMIVTDDMIETGRGALSSSELLNFVIASSVAYVAYLRSARAVSVRHRGA